MYQVKKLEITRKVYTAVITTFSLADFTNKKIWHLNAWT